MSNILLHLQYCYTFEFCDWAFCCYFINEISVTSKRKKIFNEPAQLLCKSKFLEKCCQKTMNKKTQRKICTRSCPNRSYEIWKLANWRNKLKMYVHKSETIFISFLSQRDCLKKLGGYKAQDLKKKKYNLFNYKIIRIQKLWGFI